jgi:hypothetical protein
MNDTDGNALSLHQLKKPWLECCAVSDRDRGTNFSKTFYVIIPSEGNELHKYSCILQIVVTVLTCLYGQSQSHCRYSYCRLSRLLTAVAVCSER